MKNKEYKKGFTIFLAMLVGSLALAIGAAIYDLTIRGLNLSFIANQSQYAIYAADTGAECALYWDSKYSGSGSAFGTTTGSTWPSPGSNVLCNGQDISTSWDTSQKSASAATTTFSLLFAPQPYCVAVTVSKYAAGGSISTTITARGYNTSCPPAVTATLRLERALQVSY